MFLNIEQIKKHLNIDEEYKEDDNYLLSLYSVAQKVVEKHTDVNLEYIAEVNGGELPSPLNHAILLFIGEMYRNREINSFTSVNTIPYNFDYILSLYKNYSDKNNS